MSARIDTEWAEELHEAEREALQEMRALLKSDDAKLRFKAAEAIFKFADRCRRQEARAAKAAQTAAPAPDAPVEALGAPEPRFDEEMLDRLARTTEPPPFRTVPGSAFGGALAGAASGAGETPAPPG